MSNKKQYECWDPETAAQWDTDDYDGPFCITAQSPEEAAREYVSEMWHSGVKFEEWNVRVRLRGDEMAIVFTVEVHVEVEFDSFEEDVIENSSEELEKFGYISKVEK